MSYLKKLYRYSLKKMPRRIVKFLVLMSLWTHLRKIKKVNINPLVVARVNRVLKLSTKDESLMMGVYTHKLVLDDDINTIEVYDSLHKPLGQLHDLIERETLSMEEFNALALSITDYIISHEENSYTATGKIEILKDVINILSVGDIVKPIGVYV